MWMWIGLGRMWSEEVKGRWGERARGRKHRTPNTQFRSIKHQTHSFTTLTRTTFKSLAAELFP